MLTLAKEIHHGLPLPHKAARRDFGEISDSCLPSCNPEASECLCAVFPVSTEKPPSLLKARQSVWMASGIRLQSAGMEDARHTQKAGLGSDVG